MGSRINNIINQLMWLNLSRLSSPKLLFHTCVFMFKFIPLLLSVSYCNQFLSFKVITLSSFHWIRLFKSCWFQRKSTYHRLWLKLFVALQQLANKQKVEETKNKSLNIILKYAFGLFVCYWLLFYHICSLYSRLNGKVNICSDLEKMIFLFHNKRLQIGKISPLQNVTNFKFRIWF